MIGTVDTNTLRVAKIIDAVCVLCEGDDTYHNKSKDVLQSAYSIISSIWSFKMYGTKCLFSSQHNMVGLVVKEFWNNVFSLTTETSSCYAMFDELYNDGIGDLCILRIRPKYVACEYSFALGYANIGWNIAYNDVSGTTWKASAYKESSVKA